MSDRTSGRFQSIKILLIFGLAILCFAVPFTVARFVAKDSAKDGAQVAYAVVNASGESIEGERGIIDTVAGTGYSYTVSVTNEKNGQVSEVDLKYAICVELPEDAPELEIVVSDAQKDVENSTATRLVFVSGRTFSAGVSDTNEHTVSIHGMQGDTNTYRDLNIKIKVKAEQID